MSKIQKAMVIPKGHLSICNTAFHAICRIHAGTHCISLSLEIEKIKDDDDDGNDDDDDTGMMMRKVVVVVVVEKREI